MMHTPHTRGILVALLALVLLGGCASTARDVRETLDQRSATLPGTMLGSVPCVEDAIRRTFGVVAKREGSYAQSQVAAASRIKQILTVTLTPEEDGTKGSSHTAHHIRYEIYDTGINESRADYSVDFSGDMQTKWLQQARIPLQMCGAARQ
ncbi:MAG: hypothetical protein GC151_15245 [Betaproteobacteria bacterium]|nr:hypothetical protein [Betaproteobacteria bacterium]